MMLFVSSGHTFHRIYVAFDRHDVWSYTPILCSDFILDVTQALRKPVSPIKSWRRWETWELSLNVCKDKNEFISIMHNWNLIQFEMNNNLSRAFSLLLLCCFDDKTQANIQHQLIMREQLLWSHIFNPNKSNHPELYIGSIASVPLQPVPLSSLLHYNQPVYSGNC